MNSFASPQIFTALPFSRTDTGKPPADDDATVAERLMTRHLDYIEEDC
ncbi:hypothetical protein [Pseudomonas sp. QTF5]|nr:hypothetical protein [Pseudomonas sp. QTF5]